MLRELARLNQELRVRKPYSPSAEEKKLLQLNQNWSAATRGQQFLKRGGGTGGGHIPGYSSEKQSGKLNTHNIQRQSIKELIKDAMKNKILTEKELGDYLNGEGVQIYDVLRKHYEEEKKHFEQN